MARGLRGTRFRKPAPAFRPGAGPFAVRRTPAADSLPGPIAFVPPPVPALDKGFDGVHRLVPDWPAERKVKRNVYAPVTDSNDESTVTYEHPYNGVPRSAWRRRAEELHEVFPIPDEVLVEEIHGELARALAPFHRGDLLGGRPLDPSQLGTTHRSYIHNHIADRIGEIVGFRYGDESKGEKDVVCEYFAAFSIEVKTTRETTKVTGNRSAARRRAADKPGKAQDSWYVAVSWGVGSLEDGPQLLRVSVGFLSPEDFVAAEKNASGAKAGGQFSGVSFDHPKLVDVHISDELEREFMRKHRRSVKRRIARRRREAAARAAARTS